MSLVALEVAEAYASTLDGRDRKRFQRVRRYLLRPPFPPSPKTPIEAHPHRRPLHYHHPPHLPPSSPASPPSFPLVPLVPPPRFHVTRSYGVFAAHHHLRYLVTPKRELFFAHRDAKLPAITTSPPTFSPPSRVAWASLLARVSRSTSPSVTVATGPMRIVHTVTDPDEIAIALGPRGLPRARPDPPAESPPPRPPAMEDLKQMFVYNELYDCAQSLLVYPAAGANAPTDGEFEAAGHRCGTRFIELFEDGRYSREWALAELRLLVARI